MDSMKKFVYPVIVGAFVIVFNFANGQESYNLIDQDDIIATAEKVDCEYNQGRDESLLVMTIKNNGDHTVFVHYHLDLSYNGECTTCDSDNGEYMRDYVLDPGQTIKGGCKTDFKELNVFYGWAKSGTRLLTDISLSEVDIRQKGVDKVAGTMQVPESVKNDPEAYAKWKEEWVNSHPEEYNKISSSQPSGRHEISLDEFKKMPPKKQEHIKNNPDQYVIVGK